MSVVQYVFYASGRTPTITAWQQAIDRLGVDVRLDSITDPSTHSGYLPTTYKGQSSGFEFSTADAGDAADEDLVRMLGERDRVAEFTTHDDMTELVCACYAAAAFAHAADGVAYDAYDETGGLVGPERIIEEGRSAELAL
jgi:hypothetical protein